MGTPVVVTSVLLAALSQSLASGAAEDQLAGHLVRLARVAELYRDNALRFACEETITHARPGGQRSFSFDYIYVYERPAGLIDYRTRRGEGLKKGRPPRPVHLKAFDIPAFVDRAYSWVFVFERAKQDLHRYEILGEELALGRDAVVIGFTPIPPYSRDVNDWFGKVWIDRETWQFLRVEAVKADDYADRMRFEADLADDQPRAERRRVAYAFMVITTEFTVEKNGMRFPGRVVLEKSRYQIREGSRYKEQTQLPGFRVTQTYANYRFFGVRTQDEIKAVLAGESGAP